MYEMVEKLTLYKEAPTREEAFVDIMSLMFSQMWYILVEPFPIQSEAVPVNYINGQITYTLGKPTKWAYILHKFY